MKPRGKETKPKKSEPPDVGKSIKKWAYQKYGTRGIMTLFFLSIAFTAWWQWDRVRNLPGVKQLVTVLYREGVPQADASRFSIMVANLDRDEGNELKRVMMAAISKLKGVQLLSLDRTIESQGEKPEEAVEKGHARSKEYLDESGANVLLWGTALRAAGQVVPHMYWTVSERVSRAHECEKYPIVPTDLSLPQIFWDDLNEVLQLLVVSGQQQFESRKGRYTADSLYPFIERVRNLFNGPQPGWSQKDSLQVTFMLSNALVQYGHQKGNDQPLLEAIENYSRLLNRITIEEAPLNWALLQRSLGRALTVIGEREGGTARLEEAVAAFDEALKVRSLKQVHFDWASTQCNRATALARMGEREDGTARLAEAASAFREALNERSREHDSLEWAKNQNDLGTVLTSWGEREEGTARFEEAVIAFRAAIGVFSSRQVPLYLAASQDNLGNALSAIGERRRDTACLKEAVRAYREALKEGTRERVPLDWAITQNNLGTALKSLAEHDDDTIRISEAVAAFKEALKEFTRQRVPLYWAMTQDNLGKGLVILGERRNSVDLMCESVQCLRNALEVFTSQRNPDADSCSAAIAENLGRIEKRFGVAAKEKCLEKMRVTGELRAKSSRK